MKELRARLADRKRAGELKVDAKGNVVDRESRHLLHHCNNYQRLVDADEQERTAMLANEHKYRQIAIVEYKRCLPAPLNLSTPA